MHDERDSAFTDLRISSTIEVKLFKLLAGNS